MPRPKKQKYREYEVDRNQLGDLTFFEDGAVLIGNRVYVPGALIHDVPFANGHIARRRLDQPRLLEVIDPNGEHHYFRHGAILRKWYRRIPETRQTYSLLRQRVTNLGPLAGPVAWAGSETSRIVLPWLVRTFLVLLPFLIMAGFMIIFAR